MANLIKMVADNPTPLVTDEGDVLDEVEVVLGWRNKGPTKQRGLGALKQKLSGGPRGTDLDAAALACDVNGGVISACSVDDDDPFGGAMVHQGDDTGRDREASEAIKLVLSRLPSQVAGVILTLTSFAGKGFDTVNQTSFKLLNGSNLVAQTFVPINTPRANAAVMTALWRGDDDKWSIQELGRLIHIDANFGGNADGQVNWQDLSDQYTRMFRRPF